MLNRIIICIIFIIYIAIPTHASTTQQLNATESKQTDKEIQETLKKEIVFDLLNNGNLKIGTSDPYSFFLQRVDIVISAVVILVALLTAVNMFSGVKMILSVRNQMTELSNTQKHLENEHTLRLKELENIQNNYANKYESKLEELSIFATELQYKIEEHLNRSIISKKDKEELSEILSKETLKKDDKDDIYIKLSRIIRTPDMTSLQIFDLALEKLGDDEEIRKLISYGLKEYTGKQHQNQKHSL